MICAIFGVIGVYNWIQIMLEGEMIIPTFPIVLFSVAFLLRRRYLAAAPAPDMPLPDRYAWSDAGEQTPPAEPSGWWRSFHDPTLDELITIATANNFDLRIAVERIDLYRAQYGIAPSDLYPAVGAPASYSRNRVPGAVTPILAACLCGIGVL